jgi:hypothetical protein
MRNILAIFNTENVNLTENSTEMKKMWLKTFVLCSSWPFSRKTSMTSIKKIEVTNSVTRSRKSEGRQLIYFDQKGKKKTNNTT